MDARVEAYNDHEVIEEVLKYVSKAGTIVIRMCNIDICILSHILDLLTEQLLKIVNMDCRKFLLALSIIMYFSTSCIDIVSRFL